MNDLTQLWDAAPPVGLMFALNFVLMFVKRIPHVPSWSLPLIAFVLGGIFYPLISDPAKVSFSVRCPICAQILTGLLIGGASVGTHQTFKQFLGRFGWAADDQESPNQN